MTPTDATHRTLFHGGTVFDGTGSPPGQADVVVANGRIVEVGVGLDGDDAVDCTGQLVTPGLFDCHVHFMVDGDFSPNTHAQTPFSLTFFLAAERMQRTLDCGITTVRDAGGTDLGVKEARDGGHIAGPRMQLSISILSQTGGHADGWAVCGAHLPGLMDEHPGRPHNIVDGPDEMRRKVREVVRAGADVIKVCTSGGVLSPHDDPQHAHFAADELDVLVAEATAAHRFVMAHAQATQGIKNAVRAGIRSIEHGIYLDDEAIEMMLAAGTYLVPTLIAPQGVLAAVDRGVDLPASVVEKARAVVEVHRESIRRAIDAGVRVAMGTDSGVTPHGQNLDELAEMASLGMSPAATLEASTRVAAELMGIEGDVGTLEPGKRADLVRFAGTEVDVTDLRSRVRAVHQDGALVSGGWPHSP
ncbi:MAG: amidohydrolase family protein [Actinomycetota bacterium]